MRPKPQISLTTFDRILESGGIILLMMLWVLAFLNYLYSADIIPLHYDLAGNADGYGNKATLLLIPVIPTIVYFGLTFLNRYPHIFSYPVKITEANAASQYTIATRTLRVLKISIIAIFTVDFLFTFLGTLGSGEGLGIWFLPLSLLLLVLPVIFELILSFKEKKKAVSSAK